MCTPQPHTQLIQIRPDMPTNPTNPTAVFDLYDAELCAERINYWLYEIEAEEKNMKERVKNKNAKEMKRIKDDMNMLAKNPNLKCPWSTEQGLRIIKSLNPNKHPHQSENKAERRCVICNKSFSSGCHLCKDNEGNEIHCHVCKCHQNKESTLKGSENKAERRCVTCNKPFSFGCHLCKDDQGNEMHCHVCRCITQPRMCG